MVQKGLLNFSEANYFSPTPPPTSRGCMHVIIPWPVTVYLNHSTEKWISLKFAHVQTKSKICTKVVNAKFAHPFAPLCEGVADSAFATFAQILPLLRTLLHMSKFKANSFFRPVNSTRKGCTLGTSSSSAW